MSSPDGLNISLTASLREYVEQKVAKGEFASASEVICESLRTLQEKDERGEAFWSDVRRLVAVGCTDAREGRLVDGPDAMDEILRSLNTF